jgi:uncharacterized protein (TIGR02265 family)
MQVSFEAPEHELVFQQAVEGLFFVGLQGRVTPELRTRLKAAGLDLGRLAPAYPRKSWNQFIRLTVETLWPGERPEEAYHALGRQLLEGYAETLVGKAIAGVLRLIGPRRSLQRMTYNFRSGSNYNQCECREVGPSEVLFWMNEPDLHPSYVAGILDAALEISGAKRREISVQAKDEKGCTYRVRWNLS